MPQHTDVTKNIHIILDYSGSMQGKDIQKQLEYLNQIAAQPFDDYNLSISIFGGNSARMTPGDDCDVNEKLGPNWMAMPSARNLQAINAWIQRESAQISNSNTRLCQPIQRALRDDVKDLTIIVISDCMLDDKRQLYNSLDELQRKRNNGPAKIGFIDVDDCQHTTNDEEKWTGDVYALCKAKGWWLMNVGGTCEH